MAGLSSHDAIRAWEWGWDKHPVDRALFVLGLAHPDADWDQLAALTVGGRNARLLDLREQIFGSSLSCYVTCPQCGDALEFTVSADDIRGVADPHGTNPHGELSMDGITVRFRLPDSRDLAALAGRTDAVAARLLLLRRCVTEATWGDADLAAEALPEAVVAALADRMADLDPQADLRFRLTCESCDHEWQALFDIGAFLWTEISVAARRLLREVAALAKAYGWSEGDILAMGDTRRHTYLELASS